MIDFSVRYNGFCLDLLSNHSSLFLNKFSYTLYVCIHIKRNILFLITAGMLGSEQLFLYDIKSCMIEVVINEKAEIHQKNLTLTSYRY